MSEMTRIWERLFIGGRLEAERLFRANPFNITTVITLCEEPVISTARDINYLHHPIADDKQISEGVFDAILDLIAENIRWGTILIHCGSGISRAPTIAAAWMAAAGYKNIEESLQEITKLRSFTAPSEALLKSVREHLR